jgi:hypothetical protein
MRWVRRGEVVKEILYLHTILRDVGYAHTVSTNIYEDNIAMFRYVY